MTKNPKTLEKIRHVPIIELLRWPENDLKDTEKTAIKQIKSLKNNLREKTLTLKWIQGVIRLKQSKKDNKMSPKSIIMVLNLKKED